MAPPIGNRVKEYLEFLEFSALTNDPFFGEIKKSQLITNFCPKIAPKLPKIRHVESCLR